MGKSLAAQHLANPLAEPQLVVHPPAQSWPRRSHPHRLARPCRNGACQSPGAFRTEKGDEAEAPGAAGQVAKLHHQLRIAGAALCQGQMRKASRHDDRGITKSEQIAAVGFEFGVALSADRHDVAVAGQVAGAVIQRCTSAQGDRALVFENSAGPSAIPDPVRGSSVSLAMRAGSSAISRDANRATSRRSSGPIRTVSCSKTGSEDRLEASEGRPD